MTQQKASEPDRAAWLLRLIWYGCATILVLSLPIFSDWSGPPAKPAPLESALESEVGGSTDPGPVMVSDSRRRAGLDQMPTTRLRSGGTASRSDVRRPRRITDRAGGVVSPRRQSPPPGVARVTSDPDGQAALAPSAVSRNSASLSQRRQSPPPWALGPGTLQADLEELEQGYNQAYATLFPELAAGVTQPVQNTNPFDDALNQDPAGDPNAGGDPGGSGDAPPDASGDGSDTTPDPGADPGPDPDPGGDSPPPEPEPEPAPAPSPPAVFNYLVVGDFPDNPPLVSRANLVGNVFVFENSYQVEFFPGIVQGLIGFSNNEKLMTTDFNQDGLTDFIASRVEPTVGSVVESYVQVAPGSFELHGTTALYLQQVNAFALFDLTGDDREELVLLVSGSDRLLVYELQGRDWTYLRELVLPFQPGFLLVSSAGAPLGTRLLYVMDEDLAYVVNLSPRRSQSFRFGSRAPLNHLSITEVDWFGQGVAPVLLFQLQDMLVVAERQGREIHSVAAFDLRSRSPYVILGDYLGLNNRQLIWLP